MIIDDLIIGKNYWWFRVDSDIWRQVLEARTVEEVANKDGNRTIKVIFNYTI
jgi:hypothetical protein